MRVIFSENGWKDYTSWLEDDRKILKKINVLIKDIQSHPFHGIGKPEPLKFDLAGIWSRRIDKEHRLVYQIVNNELLIYSCRYHYE